MEERFPEPFSKDQLVEDIDDKERMPIEDAQLEANMIRIKMKESLKREPEAEDYDKALAAIEDLKKFAENESNVDKVVLKIIQIGNKYFQGSIALFMDLLTLGHFDFYKSDKEHREHMLDTATERLEQLKKQAESLEK